MSNDVREFLLRVLPWPGEDDPGYCNVHVQWHIGNRDAWSGKPFRDINEFIKYAHHAATRRTPPDVYMCMSRQAKLSDKIDKHGNRKAAKHAKDAECLKAIYLDIDVGKEDAYPSLLEAAQALLDFRTAANLPTPSATVASGGGLHVYWISDRPLSPDEWRPYALGLKTLAQTQKLRCDLGVTGDSARVLRIPGTSNMKTGTPRKVELKTLGKDYDFAADLKMLPGLVPVGGISQPSNLFQGTLPSSIPDIFKSEPFESLSQGIREELPPLDWKPIAQQCGFFREALKTGGKEYSQPMWNMTTLCAVFLRDGHKLAHRMGNKHPGYTHQTTEDLWDRKNREHKEQGLGWPSCKAIQDAGCSSCATCPHFGKIRSPLNLGLPAGRAVSATPNGNGSQTDAAGEGGSGISPNDFSAYMPQHVYIFHPTREPWPAASVNSRLGRIPLYNPDGTPKLDDKDRQKSLPAAIWLDENKPVEQMTWAPGLPMLIRSRLIADGGWIERTDVCCLNLYRPPIIKPGDAGSARPWLDHIHRVYPGDAAHLVPWLAHRVQRPGEKINHALVLGGSPGIGKDSTLEPVKQAVGPWNFIEASPKEIFAPFNPFLKSVILRVSEARDLGDLDRYQFYDAMKVYTAAPPDVLRVNEKHLRQYSIPNCCGVIITTNHKADGIYLPSDDRRHYVAWSELKKEDFDENYWKQLWGWYENGGYAHVAAYLATLDISAFDPKAPPPKTAAFWEIVDANRAPEDAELSDVLDQLKTPDAVTLVELSVQADGTPIGYWLLDRKNRRAIPHRLEKCGYVQVRNDAAKDGLWVINAKRQAIYARSELSAADRSQAAGELAKRRDGAGPVG